MLVTMVPFRIQICFKLIFLNIIIVQSIDLCPTLLYLKHAIAWFSNMDFTNMFSKNKILVEILKPNPVLSKIIFYFSRSICNF